MTLSNYLCNYLHLKITCLITGVLRTFCVRKCKCKTDQISQFSNPLVGQMALVTFAHKAHDEDTDKMYSQRIEFKALFGI